MKTVFELTAETLAENLRSALRVAGDSWGSTSVPLSRADVARKAGIHRDTVGKLAPDLPRNQNTTAACGDEDATPAPPNCDLKTLCALASHLGVSPGLLLLSSQDWHRILSAVQGLAAWEDNEATRKEFEKKLRAATGAAKVELGIVMAQVQGFRPERIPDDATISGMALAELQGEIDRRNAARRRSILVTTAIAQSGAQYRDELFVLTALASQLGATAPNQ